MIVMEPQISATKTRFLGQENTCVALLEDYSPHPHIHIFSDEGLSIDKGRGPSLWTKPKEIFNLLKTHVPAKWTQV